MEFEQSGSPDSPQQGHSRGDGDSFETVRQSGPPGQPSPPHGPVKSATPRPRQGKSSPGREVTDSSAQRAAHTSSDRARDTSARHLPIIEQQTRITSASPLPVENETVRGQDQLFDDQKSASDPCEHHSDDEELDSLPHTPIDDGDLPVLLEPILKHRPDAQGLATLMDELDSWAILPDRGDMASLPQFSSKSPPGQEIRDHKQSDDTGAKPAGNRLQSGFQGDQGPSHPQHGPVKLLYSQVLAGQSSPSHEYQGSSSHVAAPDEQRGTSEEGCQTHSSQRGRQMERASPSPERTLNPREQLFQGKEDAINIRSASFKDSQRGLT